ncbi:FAD binding domain-containing protein [Mycena floridula]|nr:FAD binding domain-containing protein [Mycena floridula]
MSQSQVDVLIVGGGPTSLLLTHLLVRAPGSLRILTVEQYDKFEQGLYGRACVVHSGTLEILDLVGIYDIVADTGFIVRDHATFKEGVRSESRGWSFVTKSHNTGNTMFDFSFGLRQKHVEDALRSTISAMDDQVVQAPVKLLTYRVTNATDYPVIATLEERGKTREVHCKYLVGADGGRSTVRSIGQFDFQGIASSHKWVRLDAVITTNIPSSRSKAVSIESKEFGNILWTPVDNGRTRIGFVCPDEVYQAGNITDEVIIGLAKRAVLPFTLEFVKMDWWTVYDIGQRIAGTFRDGPVFVAGDAAHTHSSGAAQGMNTGIHDGMNLGWKLAGVLSGLYSEAILDTYDLERRSGSQRVIDIDKDTSSLISGRIPAHFNAAPDADVNDYLDQVYTANAMFTVGLGISYDANLLNKVESEPAASIPIGHRAPDGLVYRPGRRAPQALRQALSYTGKFWIIVFAGKLERTVESVRLNSDSAERYKVLREFVDAPTSLFQTRDPVWNFLTLLSGQGSLQSSETIGAEPFGKVLLDHEGSLFEIYGVDDRQGAIVVVRPDGHVGFATKLDGGEELSAYLEPLVATGRVKRSIQPEQTLETEGAGGEIDVEGEAASTYLSKV